jgi:ribosomal protein S27AE
MVISNGTGNLFRGGRFTMAEFTGNGKALDRRGFLKGSALFAAAVGMSIAAPALAQEPQNRPAVPDDEQKKPEEPAPDSAKKDGPAKTGDSAQKEDPNRLVDKSGREYRVCERCGGNMYKEGNTWTCEQCGLSYTE